MSRTWINWRFGTRHLLIGRWFISFEENSYWLTHELPCWFERY